MTQRIKRFNQRKILKGALVAGFFILPILLSVEANAGDQFSTYVDAAVTDADGTCWITASSTNPPPSTANTCTYYGRSFVFDSTSAGGKQMLSSLLLALTREVVNNSGTVTSIKHKVTLWYNDSTAPGTTEANGCDKTTMARITSVSVSYNNN